jgi:uncharacterized protein involved in exopolysaccharide biosynthesis
MKSLPRMIRATRPAGYSGEPPGPPMPASTIEDAPLSANQLMRAVETVRRRWVAVLMLMACVVIPGVYRIGHQVPVYRATAIIRLRDVQGELTGGLAGGPISELTRSIDPVRSQIEVLTSRDVASQVVDSTPELRLDASGFSSGLLDSLRIDSLVQSDSVMLEFLPSRVVVRSEHGQASGPYGVPLDAGVIRFSLRRHSAGRGVLQIRSRESAVDHVMGSIEVKQRDGTDVIDVTYFDTDPARGQRVVNRVVRVYQLSSAAAAQQRSIRRRAFLEGQLRYHDSILSAARVELSQFRGRQRAYSTKLRISSEQASLTELQVQRESMSADRRMYQDLLEQLQSNSNAPDDSQIGAIMSSPGMAANPVIGELFAQLTRYQSARDSLTTGRFGRPSNNPEVQQIDAMIASTKQKLAGGVRSYITALDAKIGSLDQLQAQSASSFPELSATEGREGVLEEQVEAARTTVGQLRSEYEKARLAEAVEVGQVEIVSLAALPRSPIGIGPLRKTVFLVLLGLGFGIGLVYLLERLNTSVRRRGQVRELLNVAELAVIPQIPLRKQLRRQRNGSTARGGSAVTGHRRPLGGGAISRRVRCPFYRRGGLSSAAHQPVVLASRRPAAHGPGHEPCAGRWQDDCGREPGDCFRSAGHARAADRRGSSSWSAARVVSPASRAWTDSGVGGQADAGRRGACHPGEWSVRACDWWSARGPQRIAGCGSDPDLASTGRRRVCDDRHRFAASPGRA